MRHRSSSRVRSIFSRPHVRMVLLVLIIGVSVGTGALTALRGHTFGAMTLICIAVALVALLGLAIECAAAVARLTGRRLNRGPMTNGALAAAGVMAALIVFEAALQAVSMQSPQDHPQPARSRIVMPDEWARREADVPGAQSGYYWHGKLHVFNEDGMRRRGPFPPKDDRSFRIMVVGDSQTYGFGVAEHETYTARLEELLASDYRAEALNLGVNGYQSSDLLRLIERFAPILEPDLIIYGICLNDFLPSGMRVYKKDRPPRLPLPEKVKRFFIQSTRTVAFLDRGWSELLIRIDFRPDFIEDVMKDFRSYRTRFAQDLRAMNQFSRRSGFGDIMAIVIDQRPCKERYPLWRFAEQYAAEAGMIVVSTQDYRRRFDGRSLRVSRWESHCNRTAHRIFGKLLHAEVTRLRSLQAYRRDGSRSLAARPNTSEPRSRN